IPELVSQAGFVGVDVDDERVAHALGSRWPGGKGAREVASSRRPLERPAGRATFSAPLPPTPEVHLSEPAILLLEDGRAFRGERLGAAGPAFGEVVFNTSMTGYQEILTDPSYAGQLVTMTYPLIGNYGVNHGDEDSDGPQVAGFIVREAARRASSWRSESSLEDY